MTGSLDRGATAGWIMIGAGIAFVIFVVGIVVAILLAIAQ